MRVKKTDKLNEYSVKGCLISYNFFWLLLRLFYFILQAHKPVFPLLQGSKTLVINTKALS